jgi:hypothetical protein
MATHKTVEESVIETVARAFHKDSRDLSLDILLLEIFLLSPFIDFSALTAVLEAQSGIEIPKAQAGMVQRMGEAVGLVDRLRRLLLRLRSRL